MTDEDKIIGEARAKAADIVMAAEEDARHILSEAKVWVATKDTALDNKLFGWVGKKICTPTSKIGKVLDFPLGSAKGCYCCSAVRIALIVAPFDIAIGWGLAKLFALVAGH